MMQLARLIGPLFLALAIGCGGSVGGGNSDPDANPNNPPPGDNDAGDSVPGQPDGSVPGTADGGTTPGIDAAPLIPGETECSDGVDNDGDGDIDGADVHCVSALDNDESSFATGIKGDNKDPKQDCFFDGNSGGGDDKCSIDLCCLLGDCGNNVDCTPSQQCIDNCSPAAPAGCDCFGCCTICDGPNCEDVLLNTEATPDWDCDLDTLDDPVKCPRCEKITSCSNECDTENCVLCPGQDEADLPAECNNESTCPDDLTTCDTTSDCLDGDVCINGCCLIVIG